MYIYVQKSQKATASYQQGTCMPNTCTKANHICSCVGLEYWTYIFFSSTFAGQAMIMMQLYDVSRYYVPDVLHRQLRNYIAMCDQKIIIHNILYRGTQEYQSSYLYRYQNSIPFKPYVYGVFSCAVAMKLHIVATQYNIDGRMHSGVLQMLHDHVHSCHTIAT